MRVFLAVTLLLTLWAMQTAADVERQKRSYPHRCLPGTKCWPSHEDIDLFAAHVTGSVLQPSSPSYRSNILYVNQRVTRHPGLVLIALSEDDVQKGVQFARKFNLLLSVRGANALTYDYVALLSNDGGFVIDLGNLRSVSPSVLTTNQFAGSVSVQAGATWQDVYSAVEATGRIVVGTNPTDGVYESTLTGGISYLSRSLGLVSDNLLSVRVVLADGRLATLSAGTASVQDADGTTLTFDDGAQLFAALRGGGFNWAVPLAFTFQLYFPPFQYAFADGRYKLFVDGTFLGRDALKRVLTELNNLPSTWGGYVMVDGTPSANDPNDKGSITVKLLHYGPWSGDAITSISSLLNYAQNALVRDFFDIAIIDTLQQARDTAGELDVFNSYPNMYTKNTLVSRDAFTNNTKLDELVDGMLGVVNAPAVQSNYRCVARLMGGQIAARESQNDALTAAYRDSAMSLTCALTWADSILREDYYLGDIMHSTEGLQSFGGGVDPRFPSEDMEDWKESLYGEKYASLLETKRRWDVDNFLWNHNHVASDIRLNCQRRGNCNHHH